jgi:hypothetical protein
MVGECAVGLFTLRGAGGAIRYISEGYLRRFMLVSLRSSRLGLTPEEIITSMFPFSPRTDVLSTTLHLMYAEQVPLAQYTAGLTILLWDTSSNLIARRNPNQCHRSSLPLTLPFFIDKPPQLPSCIVFRIEPLIRSQSSSVTNPAPNKSPYPFTDLCKGDRLSP